MKVTPLERIKRYFEHGDTIRAAEELLTYVRENHPELQNRVINHLKDLRQFQKDQMLNMNPDPTEKRRAESGILALINDIEKPGEKNELYTPVEKLKDEVGSQLADGLLAFWKFITRPGVIYPLLLFILCFSLGSWHARRVNQQVTDEKFMERLIMSRTQIDWSADQSAFSLRYPCDGQILYQFSREEGLTEIPMRLDQYQQWKSTLGAAPLESYIVSGGLTWMIASPNSFWSFLGRTFKFQQGNPQRIVLFAAAACGYLYGYYRSIRKEPSCTSEQMQKYLEDEGFWAQMHVNKRNQIEASRRFLR